jgi:hypothetical protein
LKKIRKKPAAVGGGSGEGSGDEEGGVNAEGGVDSVDVGDDNSSDGRTTLAPYVVEPGQFGKFDTMRRCGVLAPEAIVTSSRSADHGGHKHMDVVSRYNSRAGELLGMNGL